MIRRIDAIFENGVFRPQIPVHMRDGERVLLNVESRSVSAGGLDDVQDLIDAEWVDSCRGQAAAAPSLEDVRQMLDAFHGSLADRIREERDER